MWSICGKILFDVRAKEKNEQRDHQSPSEHAARELDGGESKPDDVTDSQICGAYAGRGEGTYAAGCHHILASSKANPDLAASQISHAQMKILASGEQPAAPEE